MGMTAFEIFGVLKLDKSDFEKGLSDAKSAASHVGSALSGGVSAIGRGLVTAAQVGAAAVGAAATAAVGFGKSAVSAASEYESAFTGVRKTVDATEAEYEQLSNWILDASTKMASSQEVIAGTMEIAGQLGIRGVEGLETFTETMIMLGDTTNLNAEEAASALAKFGNIAGLEAKDMDRIGSVIVDLGNNFATTEADIVGMSTRLASAGTIAGFSATDILALSTAMSSVGINAEAGGTAMSTIMTKIGRAVDSGGDKLELFAATAGMTAEEFANMWKSTPTEALQGFVKGLDGMIDSGGNVTAVLDDLGIKGIRETNTIKSLALASDVLTGAVDMANTAFKENTALVNEANLRYGTTESQMIQMQNSFKNLKIAIGEELKPMYGELMSFSTGAIQAMQKGFEEGGLEGLMSSFGTALSEGLNMLNEKLPNIVQAGVSLVSALGQGLMENLDTITNAASEILGILVNALSAGLPNILSAGSEIISKMLGAIQENLPAITESIKQFIMGLAQIIADNAADFIDVAIAIAGAIGEGLIQAAPIIAEKAPEILKAIGDGLMAHPESLLVFGPKIIGFLSKGMFSSSSSSLLKTAGSKLVTSLGSHISSGLSSLGPALSSGFSSVASFATADMGATMAAGGTAAIGTAATAILGSVAAFFGGAEIGKKIGGWIFPDDAELYEHYSGITGTLSMMKDFFVTVGEEIAYGWEDFTKGLSDGWNSFKDGVISTWDNIKDAFGTAAGFISEKVEGIKGFFGGMGDKFNEVKDRLSQGWENVKSKTSEAWGNIKSTIEAHGGGIKGVIGTYVDGYKALWEGGFNKINELTGGKLGAVLTSAKGKLTEIKGQFEEKWNNIKEKTAAAYDKINELTGGGLGNMVGIIKEKFGDVKGKFDDLVSNAKTWAKDMMDNFVKGIADKIDDVKEAAKNVAGTVKDFLGFSEPDMGPLSNFHTFAPDMMKLYAQGIRDNMNVVGDAVKDTALAITDGFDVSAEPVYKVNSVSTNTVTDERLNAILDILEAYMPTYATAQDMESMGINIDGRQFGRLVREVG